MVICQQINYIRYSYIVSRFKGRIKALLIFPFLLAQLGCLHLPMQLKPRNLLDLPITTGANAPDSSLFQVAAITVLLLLVGLGLRRWARRLVELKNPPVDREDLALLRTARDALRLLLQKQKSHLRLVRGRYHSSR